MKEEIARVRENDRLGEVEKLRIIEDKYNVIMQPAVVQLERLITTTIGATPRTPHEKNFQKTFAQGEESSCLFMKLFLPKLSELVHLLILILNDSI